MGEFFTSIGFLFSVFMGLVAGVISAALLSSIGVSDVICNLVIMIVCAIVTYFVFTWWNYTEITGRQD